MAASLASPAQAQNIKTANGTAYWDKDPGPIILAPTGPRVSINTIPMAIWKGIGVTPTNSI